MSDIDFSDYPPALAADVPIVRDGGLPTDVAVDRALAETAWYQKNLTDLSTRLTTVQDQTGDNTASITTETIARTSADEALADQITTLTATVGSNTAAISSESVARAGADSAIAANVTSLTTTVGGHTAELTTLAASISGVTVQYGVTGTIDTTTGGFVLTGVRQLDGSVSFGLEFTLNTLRLTDPNLPGGSGNVFTYSGGVFRFNVPVKIGESDVLAGASNDAAAVNYGAQTLNWNTTAVFPSSSKTITLTTKSIVFVSGIVNWKVNGPPGATASAVFAAFIRVNGSNKITAYTTGGYGTTSGPYPGIDQNFGNSLILDPGTYAIDMWGQCTAAGGSSMSVTFNAAYYTILIFKNVT